MRSEKSRRAVDRASTGTILRTLGLFGAALLLALPSQAQQTPLKISVYGSAQVRTGAPGPDVVSTPEIQPEVEHGLKNQSVGASASRVVASQIRAAAGKLTGLPIPTKEAARLRGLRGLRADSGNSSAGFKSGVLPPPPTAIPNPAGFAVTAAGAGASGFNGLNHYDQRTAGTGSFTNTQFSLEPPDQGLCAGNGFVVEAVNNAIQIFDKQGHSLAGPEALSQFWGFNPEIDRTTGVRGQFVSDPKCAFDRQSGRWFVTELMEDSGTTGTGRAYNVVGVSKTSDPTAGFAVFVFDVTDDGLNGTPSHPGCPCFGDQPLLGLDRHGIYLTTNEFGTGFNGAQVYAISKSGLIRAANGDMSALYGVAIDASQALSTYGGLSYSIQPAIGSGGDDDEDQNSHGVEYFLSALQFGNPPYELLDNRIAVWALANTAALESGNGSVSLSYQVIASQPYGQPNPAQQELGPTPLGSSLGDALTAINTNDDRMNQVIYANGMLYGALNTIIGDGSRTGIAWFAVKPEMSKGAVSGQVKRQGYVAVDSESVFFPSIALAGDEGVIAFTLTGPDYFPSAAYVNLDGRSVGNAVNIAAAGAAPADGFTGYPQLSGASDNVERWGDYSAAVSDGESVWFSTEYISGGPRTSFANWATWVGQVGH